MADEHACRQISFGPGKRIMKVSVVGSGFVGSTAAYALVMQGIGREIVLVNQNKPRAIAEAADIAHAVPFANPLTIRAGDYSDLADSCVVIMAAGVSQKPERLGCNCYNETQMFFAIAYRRSSKMLQMRSCSSRPIQST
jgi:threonine dehydrogenase-like Zn-dependent dehydrogenase